MKIFLLLSALFGLCLSNQNLLKGLEIKEGLPVHQRIAKDFAERLRDYLASDPRDIVISAILNEYADKLFRQIQLFSVENGLDPVPLGNITDEFLGSSISLWDGKLQGISTINRSDDILVTYFHNAKKLLMEFPIVFNDLQLFYDYHVIILLLGPEGTLIGKIQEFHANIKLSFDFNTYQASVEELDTSGLGKITLRFEGNGVVDLLVDILTQFVTTILRPIIEAIINEIISRAADTVVDYVNEALNDLLHPNHTNTSDFYEVVNQIRVY